MNCINDISYEGVLPGRVRGDCPRLGIVGGGRNVWEDFARFAKMEVECDIMAINLMGLFFPKKNMHIMRFMVAMDPNQVHQMKLLRQTKYRETFPDYCAVSQEKPADYAVKINVYPICWSAVYGALLARLMNYRRIVLIGCPHDNSGHFYDPPELTSPWFNESPVHQQAWTDNEKYWKGSLRSMSGRTREWLGEPTRKWFMEEE